MFKSSLRDHFGPFLFSTLTYLASLSFLECCPSEASTFEVPLLWLCGHWPGGRCTADVLAVVDALARVLSIFGAFNVGMDPGFKRYFDFKPSDSFNALERSLQSSENGQNKSKAYFLPRRWNPFVYYSRTSPIPLISQDPAEIDKNESLDS